MCYIIIYFLLDSEFTNNSVGWEGFLVKIWNQK